MLSLQWAVFVTLQLTNQRRKHHILRTMIGPSQSRNNTATSLAVFQNWLPALKILRYVHYKFSICRLWVCSHHMHLASLFSLFPTLKYIFIPFLSANIFGDFKRTNHVFDFQHYAISKLIIEVFRNLSEESVAFAIVTPSRDRYNSSCRLASSSFIGYPRMCPGVRTDFQSRVSRIRRYGAGHCRVRPN